MNDQPHQIEASFSDGNIAPISFWLKRAAQYSADVYADQLGKSSLTQRQFTVLEAVKRNEGGSQTLLVRETGIDRSTLADLVNRLEVQGYLTRQRSDRDARVNFVFLTAAGRKAVDKAQPHVATVDQVLIEVLPVRYRKQFLASLQLLSEKLDEDN
jgi:DNA-binding MarR family transcriptional regulator